MANSCQRPYGELLEIIGEIVEPVEPGSKADSLTDDKLKILDDDSTEEAKNPWEFATAPDADEVALEESLRKNPTILRNHLPSRSTPFLINYSTKTLDSLMRAHREKIFPKNLDELYQLLTLTTDLQLKRLRALTLKHLFRNSFFWEVTYPKNIPDEVVLTCFEVSLNRFFRTPDVYKFEFNEISRLSRGARMDESASQAYQSKVDEFTELGLEAAPVFFLQRSLPIVIMKRGGEPESAIFLDGSCQPLNLFGKNFNLSEVRIDAFSLKYASYVLYKSESSVLWKSLRNREKETLVLPNCAIFISREEYVFAVTREESESRIWKWVDDEEKGLFFAEIHRTPDEISRVDFGTDSESLVILKKNGSVSICHLSDNKVDAIRRLRGCFHSVWYHDSRLYTLSFVKGADDQIRIHRLVFDEGRYDVVSDEGQSQQVEELNGDFDHRLEEISDDRFTAFVKSGQIASLDGQYLKVSQRGLEVYDDEGGHVILEPEEYVASSELGLFP